MQDPMGERGTTASDVARRVETLQGFGRLDEAAEECGTGLASFPEDPRLWDLLSEIELARENFAAAEHAARTAVGLDPENDLLPMTLVLILIDRERFEEARDLARWMVAKQPEVPAANLLLAHAEAGVGRQQPGAFHLARQHAQIAVSLAPNDAAVLSSAASVMGRAGDRAEAARLVRRGLAIAPADSGLLLQQADYGARTDAGATRLIRAVLAEDPTDSATAWALRETIWTRRRLIPAFAIWSAVALLFPLACVVVVVLMIKNLVILFGGLRAASPRGEYRRSWEQAPHLRFAVPLALACLPWPLWAVATGGAGAGIPFLGLLVAELAILFAGRADERRLEGLHSASTLRHIARIKREEANTGWGRLTVAGIAALTGLAAIGSVIVAWTVYSGEGAGGAVVAIGVAFGLAAVFAGPTLVALVQAKERRLTAEGLPVAGAIRAARLLAATAIAVAATAALVAGVGVVLAR
ncbi:tetratricopeptide repeat protein [Leucobacter iarius]|uniref:Tetratricopeptide repeat protein n=1 Tax=Leucobacter iarius TaxID=333963 RepID=A0ABP4XDR1_9MICO